MCTNDWDGGLFDSRGYSRWFRDFCFENGFDEYQDTSDYKDNQGNCVPHYERDTAHKGRGRGQDQTKRL